ncbi:hypothetical protein CBL_04769 [Carabus blaptoides fortunei]
MPEPETRQAYYTERQYQLAVEAAADITDEGDARATPSSWCRGGADDATSKRLNGLKAYGMASELAKSDKTVNTNVQDHVYIRSGCPPCLAHNSSVQRSMLLVATSTSNQYSPDGFCFTPQRSFSEDSIFDSAVEDFKDDVEMKEHYGEEMDKIVDEEGSIYNGVVPQRATLRL